MKRYRIFKGPDGGWWMFADHFLFYHWFPYASFEEAVERFKACEKAVLEGRIA